jgi:hypothetical protein
MSTTACRTAAESMTLLPAAIAARAATLARFWTRLSGPLVFWKITGTRCGDQAVSERGDVEGPVLGNSRSRVHAGAESKLKHVRSLATRYET